MFDSLSDRFDGIFKRLRGHGRLERGRRRRGPPRDPPRPPRGRRQLQGRRATWSARIRERCVGAELTRRSTRPSRSSRSSTRSSIATLGGETLRITYASKPPDRRADGRPAGLGQDDQLGQAGPLVQAAGPQPAAGRRRPAAPGRRRAAAHARPPDRRARCSAEAVATPVDAWPRGRAWPRPGGSGSDVLIVDTAGRLAIDAELMDAGPSHLRGRRARLHVPRRRRHDRPGRGHRRRGLPRRRSRSTASSSPSSTATPAAAPRCRSRRSSASRSPSPRPARSSTTSTCSTPTAWPGASSAWATCSPSSRRPRRSSTKEEAEEAAAKLLEGEFTLDDFLEQMQQVKKMGPLGEPHRDDARAPQGAAERRDRRRRDRPGRGDHPLDDPRGAPQARAHRRLPPPAHRQRQRHRPPPRSTSSSSSSRRCRR